MEASLNSVLGIEWITIIEKQQQELEELRWHIADKDSPSSNSSTRSAFPMSTKLPSNSKQLKTKLSPEMDEINPLPLVDLERYADVCEQVERMHVELTQRDVELHELRANDVQLRKECEQYRSTLITCESELHIVRSNLTREVKCKEEAVERAAQAMIQCDSMEAALIERGETIEKLRNELRLRSDLAQKLERRQSRSQSDMDEYRERIAQMDADLHALRCTNEKLQLYLEGVNCQCDMANDQLQQHDLMQQRIVELEQLVEQQNTELGQQKEMFMDLTNQHAIFQQQIESEYHNNQGLAVRVVDLTLTVQQTQTMLVNQGVSYASMLKEVEERIAMQSEELWTLYAWRKVALRRFKERESVHSVQLEREEVLIKDLEHAKSSRRRVVAELAKVKRHVVQTQGTQNQVEAEIEQLKRAIAQCRVREVNIGRVLREYAKKNRQLNEAMNTTKKQLMHVSDALRRSEQRKEQVVAEAAKLKCGLVIERCQRQDILRQCIELDACLQSSQAVASASTKESTTVQQENKLLRQAVTELCAFSCELMESQETLHGELKLLEVHGQVEPQVFG